MAWHLIRCLIYRSTRAESKRPELELRQECDHPEGQVREIWAVGDPGDVSTWDRKVGSGSKALGSRQHFGWLLVDGLTVADAKLLLQSETEDGPDVTDPYSVRRVCVVVVDPVALAARLRTDDQELQAGRVEDTFDKRSAPEPLAFPRVTRAQLMETLRDRRTDPLDAAVADAQIVAHPTKPRPARPTAQEIAERPPASSLTDRKLAELASDRKKLLLASCERRAAALRAEGVTTVEEDQRA